MDTPAFLAQKQLTNQEKIELDKRKSAKWNSFTLVPNTREGYSEGEEAEYFYRMLCYKVANGEASEAKRLFYDCSLVEVYELLMLKRADQW